MTYNCIFVFIKTSGRSSKDVGDDIADNVDGVTDIYSIMGEYDLICKIPLQDISEVERIVLDSIRQIEGVASSTSALGYQTYGKNFSVF